MSWYSLVQSLQNNVWNLLQVTNKDNRTTPMTAAVFAVNFEQNLQIVLVFLMLTLRKWLSTGKEDIQRDIF